MFMQRGLGMMENPLFDGKRIARGYASDRPMLHKQVIKRLTSDLKITEAFHNGLDVGCGAGLSARALKSICDRVTGTDISREMIQICREHKDASDDMFYVAKAEETRIPETPYDIVTAAGVINWVDREAFLDNMKLVMAPGSLLVIYDFWISDNMLGNDAYTEWFHNFYLAEFPKPSRKEEVWRQGDLPEGFIIKDQVTYQMRHEFGMDAFIRFMMTQSNVTWQIQNGRKDEDEIYRQMERSLSPVFSGTVQTLIFDAYSWYIRRR